MEDSMSRSYKKVPVAGHTGADSEKYDKKIWHRRFRHKTKSILRSMHNDADSIDEVIMPVEHEVSNTWSMSKDGKSYLGNWLKKNVDMIRKIIGK
jgi:hypothetical protein